MEAATKQSPVPAGKIKSFGPFGPKYEVGQALHPLHHGDWMIEITMIDYRNERPPYQFYRHD